MGSYMRFFFFLIAFLAAGMIIGALIQLAFIRKLEDTHGAESSLENSRRFSGGNKLCIIPYCKPAAILVLYFPGLSFWNDKEAAMLRLGYIKPEVLSWSPRITLFHSFLSDEECECLKAIAKPRLQVSTVVDSKTGKSMKSNVRTSSGMFLTPREREYPMIQAIEKRISVYSQVPVENGERIQVLRYEKDQLYRPHNDYFSDTFNTRLGGQRVATMLMYLTDNVEGGETYFPRVGTGTCSCGGKIVTGLCVKPSKGDAVLFWSMGLDGKTDPKSLHGGCEVVSGEKWSATKWMRQNTTS